MMRDEIAAKLAEALDEKYEVLRWLGGGGMAQVFLARHRIHGALFAVKVLNLDLAEDDRIVARFLQEARTAATLAGHPNIVPVFDVCSENGLYFLIMQYVEGEDLALYLSRKKKLNPEEATEFVLQVADALVWASAKGVVHRDLKPSNLLLNTRRQVMVLDFGIAKAADVPSPLTRNNERLGTPHYMSPEQFRAEECDTRSDLYSLGVVFFELLTGSRPFDGNSNTAIEIAHREKPPPDLREIDSTIPPKVAFIVAKLLAKNANARYQSAQDLIDDFKRAAPPLPPPPPPPPKPAWIAILSAVALALAIAVLLIWHYVHVPPKTITDKLGGRMLLVSGGDFMFGDNEDPLSPNKREVLKLPSFYIDATEVSNRDYRKFCEHTGHKPPASETFNTQLDFPVANVSFRDAEEYAKWTGKRVPTEKEWEKAARGTDGRMYPWGNEAWTDAPTNIQPIFSCPNRISPYGAYNMAGNVAEWTSSHFPVGKAELEDITKVLNTTEFSHDFRVIKGGSFGTAPDVQMSFKTYMRRGFPEDVDVSPVIGFRCVQSAK